jgi:hypothetical protein
MQQFQLDWPPEQWGEAMATIDILSLIKLGNLSAEQTASLKKRLRQRKRELAAAMKKVDQGLKALQTKPRSKKAAKRKSARRASAR